MRARTGEVAKYPVLHPVSHYFRKYALAGSVLPFHAEETDY
jgi:hypothetical protein